MIPNALRAKLTSDLQAYAFTEVEKAIEGSNKGSQVFVTILRGWGYGLVRDVIP